MLSKLSFLTNDCFKVFLNQKQSLKEHAMSIYEGEIGYVIDDYEEHFYSVLLPKEVETESEKTLDSEYSQWKQLLMKNVRKKKRRDFLKNEEGPGTGFETNLQMLGSVELGVSFKILMTLSIAC